MPNNPGTRRGVYPETRKVEVFNVQEKLKRDLNPVVNKLEELGHNATGDEKKRIDHTVKAMMKMMLGVEAGGTHTIKVEGEGTRAPYEQKEGVPVDEALKILKVAEAALPAGDGQRESYKSLIERLEKNSQDYFKAHYKKPSNADVVSGRTPLTQEESERQDLRVRKEANLISQQEDYRRSNNSDNNTRLAEDYETGRKALDERREWKYTGVELPKTVGVVEASHSAETLAKIRTDAEINRLQNQGNFLKRFWYKSMEEGKRASLYEENLRKISGKGKKRNWFSKNILRRKDEADDKANLFAGTGQEGENFAEMSALARRFADGYIRQNEGEKRGVLTDPALNDRINELVFEYATGQMSDAEFEDRKDVLVGDVKKKNKGTFKKDRLTADNFLEAARAFRKYAEHGAGLQRTEVQLQVVLGEAKSRIKSEANLNWTENFIKKIEKNAVGKFLKPAVIGYASSVAGFLLKKPLRGLLGAAGLGGAFGIFRRSKQVKQDIAMHRAERETGIAVNTDATTAKRRNKVEQFVTNMEKSSEILARIGNLRTAYEQNRTPENRAALLEVLGDTEARMSLSAQTKRGLIEYDGETGLERSAMNMMATLAECKVLVGVSDVSTSAEYKNAMSDLRKDVEGKDKAAERFRRWSMLKAGMLGTATGFLAGAVAEEATDLIGEKLISTFGHSKLYDWMDRPSTSVDKVVSFIKSHHHIPGKGQKWWDWTDPYYKGCAGGEHIGTNHEDVKLFPGHSLKIDDSLELKPDKCGTGYELFDSKSGQTMGQFAYVNGHLTPVGKLDPSIDWKVSGSSIKIPGTGGRTVDFLDSMRGNVPNGEVAKIHTLDWYDNPTDDDLMDHAHVHAHNLNELRFYVNRDGGSGDLHLKVPVQDSIDGEKQSWLFHGSDTADLTNYKMGNLDDAFTEGRIKMIFVPDGSSPHDGIVLDFDPSTKEVILPSGSPLQKLWDPTTNKFLGGYFGLAEQTGPSSDGGHNYIWINSDRGTEAFDGMVDVPGGSGSTTSENWEILRKFNDAQCGPDGPWAPMFVPLYRRKQLEMRGGGEGAGEGRESDGETNADAVRSAEEANALRAARGNPTGTEAGTRTNQETDPHDADRNIDDDDDDEIPVRRAALTPEQQAKRREAVVAVTEFNDKGDNKNPHISLEVDPYILGTQSNAVIEKVQQLDAKLGEAMEDLRKDPKYRNENFKFRIKTTSNGVPEILPDQTRIMNFGMSQPINDMVAIFRRNLEGGLEYTQKLIAAAPPRVERAPAPAPTAAETPAVKITRISNELVNSLKEGAEHRIHFDGFDAMPEADQAKVLEEFSKAWGLISDATVKTKILNRDTGHATDAFKKGIVLGFVAGNKDIKFDNGRLLIPANKTAAEIKTFLETKATTPVAGAAPAGGGGRGGGGGGARPAPAAGGH